MNVNNTSTTNTNNNNNKPKRVWGKPMAPQVGSDEFRQWIAHGKAKYAVVNTNFDLIREHFANNDLYAEDFEMVDLRINEAMIYQIDCEHERSRKRVKLSED